MGRKLKDEEVLGTGGLTRIADLVGIMTPFVSRSILQDLNSEADSPLGHISKWCCHA